MTCTVRACAACPKPRALASKRPFDACLAEAVANSPQQALAERRQRPGMTVMAVGLLLDVCLRPCRSAMPAMIVLHPALPQAEIAVGSLAGSAPIDAPSLLANGNQVLVLTICLARFIAKCLNATGRV
jgi:hypothetical protein